MSKHIHARAGFLFPQGLPTPSEDHSPQATEGCGKAAPTDPEGDACAFHPHPQTPSPSTHGHARTRVRTTTALLLCSIALCAFTPGIPAYKGVTPGADGNTTRKELQNKGARYLGASHDTIRLRDSYAGLRCTLETLRKPNERGPYIEVLFPERNDWKSLKTDYDRIAAEISKENGQSSHNVREYPNESFRRSAGRYLDLVQGYVKHSDSWELPGGRITLSMESATDTTLTYNKLIIEIF